MDFLSQKLLTGIVILLLFISISCQILVGLLYQNMIRETDNMTITENKLLKSCKLKFTNCYQLNLGVANVPVFVDKFMNKLKFGSLSFYSITHFGGQAMLLSALVAGTGICRGIIQGSNFAQLLPYYIISFLGLYAYFSVSAFVDIPAKKRMLKINLIDYLENHMVNRLELTLNESFECSPTLSKQKIEEPLQKRQVTRRHKNELFNGEQEKELEELLKEFLT